MLLSYGRLHWEMGATLKGLLLSAVEPLLVSCVRCSRPLPDVEETDQEASTVRSNGTHEEVTASSSSSSSSCAASSAKVTDCRSSTSATDEVRRCYAPPLADASLSKG